MNLSRMLSGCWKFLTRRDYRILYLAGQGWYDSLSDEEYLKMVFPLIMGKPLNLEEPKTFNEKLQWLKLYNRKPEYTMMVDKYKVRAYIAEQLGEEYLIPLLGVWDNPDDIDFDALPDQFVLKCNHNSGLGMCICKDKSKLDIKKVKKELRKGLQEDYYMKWREWPYKDVPRKIIAEKFMSNSAKINTINNVYEVSENDLNDYKFMCFDGQVYCSFVCSERFNGDGLKVTFFDKDWNVLPFERHYPKSRKTIRKPENYDKMIAFSEKLSKDIPFVRTDFYEINGNLYFGELTFFPGSGFEEFTPESADEELGDWIRLPENLGGGYFLENSEICLWIHAADKQYDINYKCYHTEELTDYKFFCFNGYVDCVMVCIERQTGTPKFYFFDKTWRLLRLNIRGKEAPENFTLPKPKCIDEMFLIAEKLSRGKPFMRVDLYSCNEQIYFGEMTFFPDSGLDKNLLEETDLRFGELIDLKEVM